MAQFKLKTTSRKLLSDIITPVSIYLRIRDIYPNSLLLESSDYRGNENSFSFICMKPFAGFEADEGNITETYPDGSKIVTEIADKQIFNKRFSAFVRAFIQPDETADIPVNGLFGYLSYDAVGYFEKIELQPGVDCTYKIPDARYHLYKYIIAINHYQNTLQIIENQVTEEPGELDRIESLLNSRNVAIYSFKTTGEEDQNISDEQYKTMVTRGKKHCYLGDVFQVVLSRQYSQIGRASCRERV
jgi:anthranilate synthase component 1